MAHAARERQANALEILDNLIDRPTYQGLQTLLEVGPPPPKPLASTGCCPPRRPPRPCRPPSWSGAKPRFSDWTVSLALGQWPAADIRMALLLPRTWLRPAPWCGKAPVAALARWADTRPAVYQAALVPNPP